MTLLWFFHIRMLKEKKKNSSEPKFLRLKHEYNCLEMPVMYCVFATPYQSEKAGRLQAYDRRYILLFFIKSMLILYVPRWSLFKTSHL